jgi:hypothetical protein
MVICIGKLSADWYGSKFSALVCTLFPPNAKFSADLRSLGYIFCVRLLLPNIPKSLLKESWDQSCNIVSCGFSYVPFNAACIRPIGVLLSGITDCFGKTMTLFSWPFKGISIFFLISWVSCLIIVGCMIFVLFFVIYVWPSIYPSSLGIVLATT